MFTQKPASLVCDGGLAWISRDPVLTQQNREEEAGRAMEGYYRGKRRNREEKKNGKRERGREREGDSGSESQRNDWMKKKGKGKRERQHRMRPV